MITMPWNRAPGDPVGPVQAYEAMVEEPNARGMPYVLCGVSLPPGVWVDVTEAQARQIERHAFAIVRVKETTDG